MFVDMHNKSAYIIHANDIITFDTSFVLRCATCIGNRTEIKETI